MLIACVVLLAPAMIVALFVFGAHVDPRTGRIARKNLPGLLVQRSRIDDAERRGLGGIAGNGSPVAEVVAGIDAAVSCSRLNPLCRVVAMQEEDVTA